MSDATSIPILLDGDTGYGNFNNARRLIRKLEQRDVAGVCVEDKIFPKTNSFIGGERQPLADPQEFAGKLKAMKDAQSDDDFCVVARIEALIAGWGQEEALRRAELYHAAGADALLIHSKVRTAAQVLDFKQRWGDRCPVVIVPTMYYATPTEVFEEAGFNIAIWANHLMRSSVTAMQETAKRIHEDRSLYRVEGEVVSVRQLFELQGASELAEAEKRYLPDALTRCHRRRPGCATGSGVGVTSRRTGPSAGSKCGANRFSPVSSRALRASGLRDIRIVRGFGKEQVDFEQVRYIDNTEYAKTSSAHSLSLAIQDVEGALLVAYGDILYRRYVLSALLEVDHDITVVVDLESTDRASKPKWRLRRAVEQATTALVSG